jgi:hypothetical protein
MNKNRTTQLLAAALVIIVCVMWFATRDGASNNTASSTTLVATSSNAATTTGKAKATTPAPVVLPPQLVPPPTSVASTSAASVPWKLYESSLGFTVEYPSIWRAIQSNNKVSFTPLAGGDQSGAADVGVVSTFWITTASQQEYLDDKASASNVTTVGINGIKTTRMEVAEGTAGEHRVLYFFPLSSNSYLEVRFEGNVPANVYPFEAITKTIQLSKDR